MKNINLNTISKPKLKITVVSLKLNSIPELRMLNQGIRQDIATGERGGLFLQILKPASKVAHGLRQIQLINATNYRCLVFWIN